MCGKWAGNSHDSRNPLFSRVPTRERLHSLWGIDDPEYAESLKEEIALNVAAQLEEAGYTVTGKPEHRQTWTRADKQARLARNLAAQNWTE